MPRSVRLTLAVATLCAATALPLAAQVQTGSILVRLNDEQGAGVPGVTITISSEALVAGTTTGVSDNGGVYRFPSLPPGIYSVKVELQGFQGVVRENVSVQVGQTIASRSDDEGGDIGGDGHRHRHLAGRRHDQRQRRPST